MNANETTRQRNARLRKGIAGAEAASVAALAAYEVADAAAMLAPETADWDAVYTLEDAARSTATDLRIAESAYNLRDVPQASIDLVNQNID